MLHVSETVRSGVVTDAETDSINELQDAYSARPKAVAELGGVSIKKSLSAAEKTGLSPRQLQLLEQYMPAVEKIAKKISRGANGYELEDAIADGYLGLIYGVRNYDPSKVPADAETGTGYVYSNIAGSILHGLRRWYGREADGQIRRIKPSVMNSTSSSFDEPVNNGGDESKVYLHELVAGADGAVGSIDYEMLKLQVFDEARAYTDREKEILIRRVFLDESQSTIALAVGLSQMQVGRILEGMASDLAFRTGYERHSTYNSTTSWPHRNRHTEV